MVGRDQEIQVAIPIEIGIGGAPRDHRPVEVRAHGGRCVLKSVIGHVAEQQRSFAVAHLRLHFADFLLDVPVGGENIRVAIQVVIEEEDAEGEREQACPPHRRRGRFVHE